MTMRGFVEPRSLVSLSRGYGPGKGVSRSYSVGRGSGRGRGQAPLENADDFLFSSGGSGYGHGSPLNHNFTPTPNFGSKEASTSPSHGRGSAGLPPGPSLPVGRGAPSQRPGDSDRRSPSLTFSVGLGSFGRGKPAPSPAPTAEDISFLEERRHVLPKWEETMKKIDDTEGVSAAELRLLGDEASDDAKIFPGRSMRGQNVPLESPAFSVRAKSPDVQRGPSLPTIRLPEAIPQATSHIPGSPQGSVQSSYGSAFQGQAPPGQPLYNLTPPQSGPLSQQAVPRPTIPVPKAIPQVASRITRSPQGSVQSSDGSLFQGQPQPQPPSNVASPGIRSSLSEQDQAQPESDLAFQSLLEATRTRSDVTHPEWTQSTSMPQLPHSQHKSMTQPRFSPQSPHSSSSLPCPDSPLQYSVFDQPPVVHQEAVPYGYGSMDDQYGQWSFDDSPSQAHESGQHFTVQDLGPDADLEASSWASEQPVPDPVPVSSIANATSDASAYDYDWGSPPPAESGEGESTPELHAGVTPRTAAAVVDYNAKIEECLSSEKVEDIDVAYADMKASDIQADAKTYDAFMQAYMKMGKMDKFAQVYQDMRNVLLEGEKGQSKANVTMETLPPASKSTKKPGKAMAATDDSFGMFIDQSVSGDVSVEAVIGHPSLNEEVKIEMPAASTSDVASPPESPGFGMGRGKKVERFFDFSLSGALSSASGVGLGRGKMLLDEVATTPEKADDYSQTFRPVIKPEWQYAFAPQSISVGPGAGRGRPSSAQTFDIGLRASPQGVDSSMGRGMRLSSEFMDRAARPQALYDRQPKFDYTEEPSRPSSRLTPEEAGERAMSILKGRFSRRIAMLDMYDDQKDREKDAEVVQKRPSIWDKLSQEPKEKKQPRKSKVKKEVQRLIDEEEKEDIERLKVMAKSREAEELKKTVKDFMELYGQLICEPEHIMIFENPDIHETPPPSLEEYLELAKPHIMKTGLIRSEEEWKRSVKDVLKDAPYYEHFAKRYGGQWRLTAKQENEDLDYIASMLPSDVIPAAKSCIQRHLTTLKNNPGMNLDEKQWLLANMVDTYSYYTN